MEVTESGMVTEVSFSQLRNVQELIVVMELGMSMEVRPLFWNVKFPMEVTELGMLIDVSFGVYWNALCPMVWTVSGMVTDVRNWH
jgi:hypothetical protein